MDDMLDWLKENTNHTFATYVKSKEGAWISPHTLPGHKNNFIWHNTKLGQSAQRKYSTTAWETDFLEQLLPSLITVHNLRTDIPFIDVGCGDGRITYLLHRAGFNKLVGIDLDEINVRNAASQTPSASLNNIIFMTGDVLCLPFKHNTLQQIFISGLPSLSNVFLNIYPLLTDSSMRGGGGYFFFLKNPP
ncbi:class I SAM-dependent methyltransferase [Lawsonia intracellularis]|uniref:class I SAM-dependent methyltransferase n=1 Tax=Lawsonia intracellularis TaxID=29546 RepID=UPI00214C52AB|nr:class I SAM-dependent methyltransferase [Lawsonia intracellularis]